VIFLFPGGLFYKGVFYFVPCALILYIKKGFLPQGSKGCKNKWRSRWRGVLNWIDKEKERIRKKKENKK